MKTDYQEQRRRRVKKVAQRVSAGKSCMKKMTSAGGAAQCMSSEATELCRPSGAGDRFCRLPRAYALGYLLDAPPALGYLVYGDVDRL